MYPAWFMPRTVHSNCCIVQEENEFKERYDANANEQAHLTTNFSKELFIAIRKLCTLFLIVKVSKQILADAELLSLSCELMDSMINLACGKMWITCYCNLIVLKRTCWFTVLCNWSCILQHIISMKVHENSKRFIFQNQS